MANYDAILKPITIGSLTLKNRIVFAPTSMGLRKSEYFKRIEEIAKGGTSMIIIGDVPVLESPFPLTLYSKHGFEYYKEIANLCHKYNCKVCAQLHQNDTVFKGMGKYIPLLLTKKISREDLKSIISSKTGEYISSLPLKEVEHITSSFGRAAIKAKEAGFDMVQVHGDRMTGSFSSSLFNTRKDKYSDRTLFAREAVRSIRSALPDFPIDYKLAVRIEKPNYGKAGVLFSEIKTFVPLLEKEGVNSFHVTLANHGKLEDTIPPFDHEYFMNEGCFLPFCDEVKKYTILPVCGVGNLSNPDFINEQIKSGRIDMASMSRQLIADSQYVNKIMNDKASLINVCKRCNKECLGGMYNHKGVHCIYDKKENEIKEESKDINY